MTNAIAQSLRVPSSEGPSIVECHEAADEIERLEREGGALREAVRIATLERDHARLLQGALACTVDGDATKWTPLGAEINRLERENAALREAAEPALRYIQHVGANHTERGEPHPQRWIVDKLTAALGKQGHAQGGV